MNLIPRNSLHPPLHPLSEPSGSVGEKYSESDILNALKNSKTGESGIKNITHDTQHDIPLSNDVSPVGIYQSADMPDMLLSDIARVVSHGERVVEDTHGEILNTIVRQAGFMLKNGQSVASIRLDPPSLGKLKLEIVTEHSRIAGKITVETKEAKDIIENRLSELRESLAQNGLKVESFDVQVGHNGGTDNWARREDFERMGMTARDTAAGSQNASEQEAPQEESTGLRGKSLHSELFDTWI